MIAHTFLFEPGDWLAEGTSFDDAGAPVAVTGRTRVTHEPGGWRNAGVLRLETDPPEEFANTYTFAPLAPGAAATTWSSANPALGRLTGALAAVADAILMTGATADSRFTVCESLRMIDATTYEDRGALFADGELVSSWAVRLTKVLS